MFEVRSGDIDGCKRLLLFHGTWNRVVLVKKFLLLVQRFKNIWMSDQNDGLVNEWRDEWMSELNDGLVYEWRNEWMSDQNDGLVNAWRS